MKTTLLIKDHDPVRLSYNGNKRGEFFGTSLPVSTLIPVTLLYTDGVLFETNAVAISSKPMPLSSEKR